MTVIYSNFGDNDTLVLPGIWANIPDVNVVEITSDSEDFEEMVDNAILQENDTIIFCGHGSTQGLLHPNLNSGQYILHENNCHLIHANRVIGIWCYASEFAEANHLNGFFSWMFISNLNEAYEHGYTEVLATEINTSMLQFIQRLNGLIRADVPIEEWVGRLQVQMNPDIPTEVFNYMGLTYLND